MSVENNGNSEPQYLDSCYACIVYFPLHLRAPSSKYAEELVSRSYFEKNVKRIHLIPGQGVILQDGNLYADFVENIFEAQMTGVLKRIDGSETILEEPFATFCFDLLGNVTVSNNGLGIDQGIKTYRRDLVNIQQGDDIQTPTDFITTQYCQFHFYPGANPEHIDGIYDDIIEEALAKINTTVATSIN
ncbi:MAG: hypothetical protein ACEQSA_00305 [Weeksellaceae bacterium]